LGLGDEPKGVRWKIKAGPEKGGKTVEPLREERTSKVKSCRAKGIGIGVHLGGGKKRK